MDIGPKTLAERITKTQRSVIGHMSMMNMVNDVMKFEKIASSNRMLGGIKGENGIIELAAKTIRLMETDGLTAAEAAAKIRNFGGQDMNSFHAVSRIMANLSHDDILDLDALLKRSDWKARQMTTRVGTEGTQIQLPELAKASEHEHNLFRKYGQLIDYWAETELSNVPNANSNLLLSSPHGFFNKMMTMFLKPAVAALNGMGIASANMSLAPRAFMLAYSTAVAMGLLWLKSYIAGGNTYERYMKDWETPVGQAKIIAQALEYSGYLGIVASKVFSAGLDLFSPNGMDRANAGEFETLSPVQSTLQSLVRGVGGGLADELMGKDANDSKRNAIRKYVGFNLFDNLTGDFLKRGMYKVNDENYLGNGAIGDAAEWLFPKPRSE